MRTRTRAAVATIVIAATLGASATAQGAHWWVNGNGHAIHLNRGHAPLLTIWNRATNGSWTPIEHTRGDWSARVWAMDIGNWASNQADITAWDGRWCTDWSGLATPVTNAFGANTTYWDGHVDWMWVQINTCSGSYAVNASYKPTRAVACQELGHATTAELHAGPGCMGFGYFNFNAEDAAQRSPSAHDVEGANFLWGGTH